MGRLVRSTGRVSGFTLIEAFVVLFVVSLITLTFYQTWSLGTAQIQNAKYRLGASAIADQQMEMIRGLVFDNIGTTTGIPNGILSQDQTILANNTSYTVHTVVQFIDDATDGTLAASTDIAPNDYKKVTVTVSWGSASVSEQVRMTSLFSLDGVESVAAGTGILSINVLNNAGIGVADASVHITNTSVVPNVNITATTDTNGNLMFPGALASAQDYHISADKSGYYGVLTYAPYPTSVFKPTNVHASVVAGSLTATTLVMDEYADIEIYTEDPFGVEIPNVDFTLSGGSVIGTDAVSSLPVYDFSQTTVTDSDGRKNFSDRSSGAYTVALDLSETTQYQFLRLDPEAATHDVLNAMAGDTTTIKFILADKTMRSALITVTNTSDGTPIAAASVRLHNVSLGYDTTLTADTYGQVYFPTSAVPLDVGTYDIEVSASGFVTETDTIILSGSSLVEQTVSLDAS